jgi:uncharacterized membrane protein YcaP (DUF421 family)
MDVIELAIRITLTFLVLFTVTRMTGRIEISQMTFFNFVSAITIGTIGGAIVTSADFSILNGILALVGWGILTILMEFIDIKSKKARTLLSGQPIIVIKDGMIMEQSLRKVRVDINELKVMLREKNVFSISDVDYAILETNGKLSVLKKESKQSLTKSDMNINSTSKDKIPLSTEVVSDGIINEKNLSKLNLDEQWLEQQLKKSGVQSVSDVFYAEVQQDGSLYIDSRNDTVH